MRSLLILILFFIHQHLLQFLKKTVCTCFTETQSLTPHQASVAGRNLEKDWFLIGLVPLRCLNGAKTSAEACHTQHPLSLGTLGDATETSRTTLVPHILCMNHCHDATLQTFPLFNKHNYLCTYSLWSAIKLNPIESSIGPHFNRHSLASQAFRCTQLLCKR